MQPVKWHSHGSYLGNLDEAFTWISKKVLQDGVMSVVSYQPAEIFHHLERRLTNPTAILDPYKLAPVTAREHDMVHAGRIHIDSTPTRKLSVVDFYGAKFLSDPAEFRELWQHYLDEWYAKGGA